MSGPRERLAAALASHAEQRPHHVAICDETLRLTWRELNAWVASIASKLPEGRFGLSGGNSCAWVVTYIAALLSRRTVVPIPPFFSAQQRAHIARAADLADIVTTNEAWRGLRNEPVFEITKLDRAGDNPIREAGVAPNEIDDAVVVFTSGSTGQPKGVRLTLGNLLATADGLVQALKVTENDSYLSVLPLSMLLEQVCAVLVPLLTGAASSFCAEISSQVVAGRPVDLIDNIARTRPSILVLVPQLLGLLVDQVKSRDNARDLLCSVRYIAVGGAAVGSNAVGEARNAGLPVFEGYGLTECSSVVAINTPQDDYPGTVGKPLPGHRIEIVDGEICVSGPSVMAGYLGAAQGVSEGRWLTGDVGELRSDGVLLLHGRKDNLIVCSNGRNVSPEWVEAAIVETKLVRNAIVVPAEDGAGLAALLIADWSQDVRAKNIKAVVDKLDNILPVYARPRRFIVIASDEAKSLNLYRMGKPDRCVARSCAAQEATVITKEWEMKPYDRLVAATRPEREAFMRLPLVQHAVAHGASRETYLAFLGEAFHHVKHTFPLLALSASMTEDHMLREALAEYMKEEFGHENWILDDIKRMGGDAEAVAASKPRFACRVMVAHVYYSVQWESPYAVLGMVHVLEGLSVLLADKLAGALKSRFGSSSDDGFSYLRTHGALDVEHTAMFERLMNSFSDPAVVDLVIDHTRMMYRLYGDIFADLAALEMPRAA